MSDFPGNLELPQKTGINSMQSFWVTQEGLHKFVELESEIRKIWMNKFPLFSPILITLMRSDWPRGDQVSCGFYFWSPEWQDVSGELSSTWPYQPSPTRKATTTPAHHNNVRDAGWIRKQRPGWQLKKVLLCCTTSMPGQESDRLHLLILDSVMGPNRQIGSIQDNGPFTLTSTCAACASSY